MQGRKETVTKTCLSNKPMFILNNPLNKQKKKKKRKSSGNKPYKNERNYVWLRLANHLIRKKGLDF